MNFSAFSGRTFKLYVTALTVLDGFLSNVESKYYLIIEVFPTEIFPNTFNILLIAYFFDFSVFISDI